MKMQDAKLKLLVKVFLALYFVHLWEAHFPPSYSCLEQRRVKDMIFRQYNNLAYGVKSRGDTFDVYYIRQYQVVRDHSKALLATKRSCRYSHVCYKGLY